MQIEVTIPSLLADCAGGRRRFALEADTLADALRRLLEEHPRLRPHLYDEAMHVRKHVLIFFNDDNLAGIENRTMPLKAGDRLQVVQAVSGG
ncbi:MAG TPA: MoaD/ThiS family protein [Opitutaceae bacterium]|nr:MoaD/ThiS family protein [Opitutaceae bacterium]